MSAPQAKKKLGPFLQFYLFLSGSCGGQNQVVMSNKLMES